MNEANESPIILQTVDLTREYNSGSKKITAVNHVNARIRSSALTILKGRSGSGKTTLVNLLGGMDSPTSGEVYFCGENITSLSDSERDRIRRYKMGFVFQSSGLMSYMSAYENVEFGLRIAGCNPRDRRKRAEECLEMVGLGKRMHHRPYEMSGGEQQRVAIARAIAHRPKIIFADEPTSALDTAMSLQVVKTFKELIKAEGVTIVMTTHDTSMVEIADDVITLKDGEMVNE